MSEAEWALWTVTAMNVLTFVVNLANIFQQARTSRKIRELEHDVRRAMGGGWN